MRTLSRRATRIAVSLTIIAATCLGGLATPQPARALDFYTVDTLADGNDGECVLDCTLREALDVSAVNDIINFGVTGTLTVSLGELVVDHNVTIAGPGAGSLTIDAGGGSRVFNIGCCAVGFSGLTVTGGAANEIGGAFYIHGGVVSMDNMVIKGNQAGYAAGYNFGGGVYLANGTLSIFQSEVSNNTVVSGVGTTQGGGIYGQLGTLNLTNVTVSGNHAGTGGGNGAGGGLLLGSGLTANLNNVTIAGNDSDAEGGGLEVHATITSANIKNSIVADNSAPTSPDCNAYTTGINSEDYNLIEDTSYCLISGTTTHNLAGVDPALFPLGNYGGNTQTMALASSSLALDAGDSGTCAGNDQRGVARPQGANCDMGAFEIEQLTVTKTADTNDGTCDSDCSLREAMALSTAGALIDFSVGGTFPLASELPTIFKILTIDGSGQAVTLDGQNSVRIFVVWSDGNLTGLNLTLSNGYGASPTGGAALLLAFGTATFHDTTFTGNISGDGIEVLAYGGAIQNDGTLNLNRSTFSDNHAVTTGSTTGYGGAIYSQGTLTITNSTFTGNSADFGGAIFSYNGALAMSNGTIAGNTADGEGGGLYNDGTTTVSLKNSILADSVSGNDCYSSFGATMSEDVNNLIETSVDCGTPLLSSDPMLQSLDNTGGFTQTMALMEGSPAIDAGDDPTCAADPVNALDQRGVSRPEGGACDIGAYEFIVADTIGINAGGWFFLRNANAAGPADNSFPYGWAGPTPLMGDWNGDGTDNVGIDDASWFFLSNSNSSSGADYIFQYGWAGATPLVGDWDGDGEDTPGICSGGWFFLRNSNSPGPADMVFSFGWAGPTPLAGDWNGDGMDTIGIYDSSSASFFLRNTNTPGPADLAFTYGFPGATPLMGDWNGDGLTTVGITSGGTFYMRNTNTPGPANLTFNYGWAGATPLAGTWDLVP